MAGTWGYIFFLIATDIFTNSKYFRALSLPRKCSLYCCHFHNVNIQFINISASCILLFIQNKIHPYYLCRKISANNFQEHTFLGHYSIIWLYISEQITSHENFSRAYSFIDKTSSLSYLRHASSNIT